MSFYVLFNCLSNEDAKSIIHIRVCVWADIERHLFDLNITRRRDEFHKEDFYGKKSGRFFRFLVLVGVIAIIVLKFMDI